MRHLMLAVAIAAFHSAPAFAAPSEGCNTDAVQAMAPPGTTVAMAVREVFADRDEVYAEENWGCRVSGWVTNQNPGPNRVMFNLTLPDNFNGRYVYLGIGGAAGKIPNMPQRLLARGFALAGSDGGTGAKSIADFSFMSDPARLTDFMWRGVQSSAEATQAITRAYYRREKLWRYISGCSGGGQMALGNARRFGGQNFDGFLVGATPFQASLFHPNVFDIAAHMQNQPESWISPDLMGKAGAGILAAYDELDGAKDGIIHDPSAIVNFDYAILRQAGFSQAQVALFDRIRKTHKFPSGGAKGDGTHPGWSISDVSGWSRFLLGTAPPPWPGTNGRSPADLLKQGVPFIHIMSDTKTRSMEPNTDYWKIASFAEVVRISSRGGASMPFTDPMDYSALAASGAKMVIWHGVDDESMSYLESQGGYHVLRARFPTADNWVRYVPVPGLWHCRGGAGPTDQVEALLDAIIPWVEQGTAPVGIVANRFSPERGRERSMLLCTEPRHAKFKGGGLDPKDAGNWECRGG
jgi:Tannase and feruloyl esterase